MTVNLSQFIARRYFFSKKKKNFINVISIISMIVVAVGTMALIIVLSVFNGLEGLLRGIYGTVDPNLIVEASSDKSFAYGEDIRQKVKEIEGVHIITEVIEDNALLRYNDAQRVARVKGVSENFLDQHRLDKSIAYGEMKLTDGDINYAIMGRGVQYDLSVNPKNEFYNLQVFYPNDINPGVTNPEKMFRINALMPGAIFAIENYYDNNYIFVPIRFTEQLFDYKGRRTSLEIQITPESDIQTIQAQLQQVLGEDFTVKSSEEIHSDLYKILKIEKLFVFLIFSIIIAIASINIYFALTMLVIDKQKDIAILKAMGAQAKLIRNIFLKEGTIIAFSGASVGLFLGLGICWLQITYGLITTGTQTMVVQAYPVEIEWADVCYSIFCIISITIAATLQPAFKAAKSDALPFS